MKIDKAFQNLLNRISKEELCDAAGFVVLNSRLLAYYLSAF